MAIALGTMVKTPGEAHARASRPNCSPATHPTAAEMDAYERLLGDAMKGDATQFAREDYVEEAWRIVAPVLGGATPVHEYDPGTWGPAEADRVAPDGGWHNPLVSKRTIV